ncbi:phage portal protein [Mesorhizobium sp. CN2-181]|uniref:phage portal protein n=1 Tax=Mesorhizobium yinganensis TaxID=3157707 RepID=UPI0032B87E47
MWPFKTKPAPIEQKSLQTDEELLALLGGGLGGCSTISRAQAFTVPAVQNAIKLISESVALAHLSVKRRVGEEEVDVPEHPALALLRGQVNGWTSGYEFLRDLVVQALSQDAGGLAYANKVNGEVREIIRYDSGILAVAYSSDGTGEPIFRISGKVIPSANAIHVRGPFQRCPLSLAADAITAAKTMESYVVNFWQQSARPGGVISSPKAIGEAGVTKMLAGWKAAFGGAEKAGRTAILYDGATWQQMTMTSVDAQLLELRKFQLSEIARAFGIPQHMLGVLERATWGNYSQAAKEYLTATVLPWMRAVESALDRALLTDEERADHFFRFDLDDFSQGSLTERATAINGLITSRTISPNEGRNWLGLQPREGGDEYANPNTGSSQPDATPAAPTPDNDNIEPEKEAA